MNKAKILIVEDELITAENMKEILESKGYAVPYLASNEKEVMEAIKSDAPDAIVMDIRLHSGIEGIRIAKEIRRLYAIPIIYVTKLNDEEIFQKAKETFPKNYLTKPFTEEMLLRAIELAVQNANLETGSEPIDYSIKDGVFFYVGKGEHIKILFNDILYLEADGNNTFIGYESKQKLCNTQMVTISSNNVFSKLSYPPIKKVHKSYYINVQKITSYNNEEVIVGGKAIPISKDYRAELVKYWLKVIKQKGDEK